MRRRRGRRWLLRITVWAVLIGRDGSAQTAPLPAALDPRQTPFAPAEGPAPPGSDSSVTPPPPPAPQPIPGPAGTGLPVGGMDAQLPQGLPINLATAMQLAGAAPGHRDRDRASQAVLAQQLQAQALWIPNLNAGVDYFRHDGVQQNLFTGQNFIKGRQSLTAGGGPSLSVGLTDAIFAPLAARQVVAARWADLRPRGTTPSSRCPGPSSTSRRLAGGSSASVRRSRGPSCS